MPAIRLENGNLLIPVVPEAPDSGFGYREIGPDHPDYDYWLAQAIDEEDPKQKGG